MISSEVGKISARSSIPLYIGLANYIRKIKEGSDMREEEEGY